jgi:hypothetical protein
MNFSGDDVVIVRVIEAHERTLNTGPEIRCRLIKANYIFSQKADSVAQIGGDEKIVLTKTEITIGAVFVYKRILEMPKSVELRLLQLCMHFILNKTPQHTSKCDGCFNKYSRLPHSYQ